jgi:hypothetical protein
VCVPSSQSRSAHGVLGLQGLSGVQADRPSLSQVCCPSVEIPQVEMILVSVGWIHKLKCHIF